MLGGVLKAKIVIAVVDSEQERLYRGPELSACEGDALLAERRRYYRVLHRGNLCT